MSYSNILVLARCRVDFSAALLDDVEEGEVEDRLVVVDGLVLLHLRDLRVGQEAKNVPW